MTHHRAVAAELLTPAAVRACRGLNEHTNFERFWTAALTLFKIATNDNWTDVMVACMIKVSFCKSSEAINHSSSSMCVRCMHAKVWCKQQAKWCKILQMGVDAVACQADLYSPALLRE
jgi:hypothetical protein